MQVEKGPSVHLLGDRDPETSSLLPRHPAGASQSVALVGGTSSAWSPRPTHSTEGRSWGLQVQSPDHREEGLERAGRPLMPPQQLGGE